MRATSERRRAKRENLCSPCSAIVGSRLMGMYWVEDVSCNGIGLRHGSTFDLGTPLSLAIHFPWCDSIAVDGMVVHQTTRPIRQTVTGVAFNKNQTVQSRIAQVMRQRARAASGAFQPIVLLAVGRRRLARTLYHNLHQLGARVVTAHFPLEVAWQLAESGERFDAVFFDHRLAGSNIVDWLSVLEEEYPSVRRAMVLDDQLASDISGLLTLGLLQAVFAEPWDNAYLSEFVNGCRLARSACSILPAAQATRPQVHANAGRQRARLHARPVKSAR